MKLVNILCVRYQDVPKSYSCVWALVGIRVVLILKFSKESQLPDFSPCLRRRLHLYKKSEKFNRDFDSCKTFKVHPRLTRHSMSQFNVCINHCICSTALLVVREFTQKYDNLFEFRHPYPTTENPFRLDFWLIFVCAALTFDFFAGFLGWQTFLFKRIFAIFRLGTSRKIW